MKKIISKILAIATIAAPLAILAPIAQAKTGSLQNMITYYTKNDGTSFARSVTPFSSGVATQVENPNGSVTISDNSAPGYADSGFVVYNGKLGDLNSISVAGTGDEFGLNLWFDKDNDGEYFNWDASGVLTSVGGDTYAFAPGSVNGALSVDDASSFYSMQDGKNYTLARLKAGDLTGVKPTTNVAIWVGVTVGNGGSKSATINSMSVVSQHCATLTYISSANTLTAGYTATNPSADPLNPAKYAGSLSSAVATTPVIPPWVNPSTDSNFVGSGAVWVNTSASWPGGFVLAEGDPHVDQWRLFQDNLTLPAGAMVKSASLAYTADNSAQVYLNSSPVASINGEDVFAAAPAGLPYNFSSVFSTSFNPAPGVNTLSFVVRNWGDTQGQSYSANPTGLLYKAVVDYCVPTVPTNKDQCKDGGWQNLYHLDGLPFKNQGDCVSFVASKGKAKGNP